MPTEQKEWLFNPDGKFDIEKSEEKLRDFENIDCALHLQHLAFALHKIFDELQSGGRYRSKYFDEIKAVLEDKAHSHGYLTDFCKKLQSNAFKLLTTTNLTYLIAHLSNLELKPLRKYFNDEKHKKGDVWQEERLSKIFGNWILHEWRVNLEKDKHKVEDGLGDYKKLRKKWNEYAKQKPGKILAFFLESGPFYTIPPYQDNNNRRPPKCQSLILNPVFLDRCYPAWQDWLGALKKLGIMGQYLGDFQTKLDELKSGKKLAYFSDESLAFQKDKSDAEIKKTKQEIQAANSQRRNLKALDARILQFIFDRVKSQ